MWQHWLAGSLFSQLLAPWIAAGISSAAVDERTNGIFVPHDNADSVFDTRTGTLIRTNRTGQYAGEVAVDQQTGRAFITHFGKNGRADDVSVLDASSGRVLRTVTMAGGPGMAAVDVGANRVFVVQLKAISLMRVAVPQWAKSRWARIPPELCRMP